MINKISQLLQSKDKANIYLALELIEGQEISLKELPIVQQYAQLLGWLHYDIHFLGEDYSLFLYEPDELGKDEFVNILIDLLETEHISLQIDSNPPPALWLLPKLRSLELKSPSRDFNTIPSTIANLKQLDALSIGAPAIDTLPNELYHLHQLKFLSITGTAIKSLPNDITALHHLEQLDLGHNKALLSLPDQLPKGLKYIYLNDCSSITRLPDNICQLPLTRLNLWGTSIRTLPENLSQLHNLRYLGLQDTPLESLPPNLNQLQNLRSFFTDGSKMHQQARQIKKQLQDLRYYD